MKTQKRKALVGYIYKCEFNDVLCWQDGEWMMINEDVMPFKHRRSKNKDDKVCGCPKKHPMQKIRLTLEEI